MLCPYCEKTIEGLQIAMRNLEAYNQNGTALAATECCGKGVVLKASMVFSVRKYEGEKKEDDWGNPIKKS